MFEALQLQPADGLLALIKAFAADSRSDKVDLGVGVYRNAEGRTPVMTAVKDAERILLETQDSKRYLGPEGDLVAVEQLKPLIFGTDAGHGIRLTGLQTPGGSGALRLGGELLAVAKAGARIWIGTPTWPNHIPIFSAARLDIRTYPLIDLATQSIAFDGFRAVLEQAEKGDIILLHGCCHNPTGIDFSIEQWRETAELLAAKELVPFIDLAYQGLGLGLDQDAAATRLILDAVPEALIAYSCDKNFGLYRDRVGALYSLARNGAEATSAAGNMAALARVNWSMPPDHGMAIVRTILESPSLTALWRAELIEMSGRIVSNRELLSAAHPSLAFIRDQRGLFSNLDISKDQAVALRLKHGIYVANSGRMNLAGMGGANDVGLITAALKAEGCL